MRKVCVVTGSRADYGLLKWVMKAVQKDSDLLLQIIVTGMHLSPAFGMTVGEIENDGFVIDKKVETLVACHTSTSIAKSMGLGMIGLADAISDLNPDCLLVLGDRFEIFSAVAVALVSQIPVVHLHGGEITQGAFDDSLRHSITKMSHLHCVATEEYYRRVVQLGEDPHSVFVVGGLGVDGINKLKLLSKSEIEQKLNITFSRKNLLITFHPVTTNEDMGISQFTQLLKSLSILQDTTLIFTSPNADTHSSNFSKILDDFIKNHPNAHVFLSLGQLTYLSCMAQVDAVIGNSSSGLMEAPTLKKGTINIGERQHGRMKAGSIIDCEPFHQNISSAIKKIYSDDFQKKLIEVKSPYGNGGASDKVVFILKNKLNDGLYKKSFYDL